MGLEASARIILKSKRGVDIRAGVCLFGEKLFDNVLIRCCDCDCSWLPRKSFWSCKFLDSFAEDT